MKPLRETPRRPIEVCGGDTLAQVSLRRCLDDQLLPVLETLADSTADPACDVFGHPVARLGPDGRIEAVNEAWRWSSSYRAEATGVGVSYASVLATAELDPDAQATGRAVRAALDRVGTGGAVEVVVYFCDPSFGFVALAAWPAPSGGVFVSHVDLDPFLALARSTDGRLRGTFDGMLEAVFWCEPLYGPDGQIRDFVYLDITSPLPSSSVPPLKRSSADA